MTTNNLSYYIDGTFESQWRDDDGLLHRDNDLPAVIVYNANGNVVMHRYYNHGQRHRINNPAIIDYYQNKQVRSEQWLVHDNCHRVNAPAYMDYDMDGNVKNKAYWWNNVRITDIVSELFGNVPTELSKEQIVLLRLSLPEECLTEPLP